MTDPGRTEIEWQFDADDLDRVIALLEEAELDGLTVCRGPVAEITDRYFDSSDRRLGRAGLTARLRLREGRLQLGLKTRADPEGGLRQRLEFEEFDPPQQLTHLAQAPGPAGHILRMVGEGAGYEELFTLTTTRRTYLVKDGGSARAEIALDESLAGARGDAGPGRLLRVEVEVIGQQGIGPARRAAEYLRDRVPLRPAALSKFEFGLSRSTRGTRGEPSPGRAGENLTADSPADTVARAVVGHQLEALVANEPAARAGFSAEPLHDLRVAARRMRAALSLFKRQLPAELLAYRDEARWIGRATGPLRDLDVHLAAATDDSSGPAAPEDVVGLLRERQARARRAMIRALASPRFARFVSGCHELLEEAAPAPAGERPVAEVAVPLLDRRYASMRRRGRRLGPGSPAEDFHELRIAAKKLRYALEFLAPIFGRELKRYRSRLVSLQDLLGEHQDADVSAAALRDLARAHAGRLSPDGRRFVLASAEAGERKAKHLRRRFPDVWDRLSPSPWKGVLAACER